MNKYIYIYTYVSIYMYLYIYTCIHINTYTHAYRYIHTCIHTYHPEAIVVQAKALPVKSGKGHREAMLAAPLFPRLRFRD